jgi:16S rRNA (guanine966-N2)-methyltransferase
VTRIIAGSAKGRRLATPKGSETRPTSDRVREALFSAVEAWCGSLHGLRVLDLYAGSGALGLEAWSRGADHVTLVESDRRTAALIAANARDLGCDRAEVRAASVATTLSRSPDLPYDLVLSDPPYPLAIDAVRADLVALRDHGWLGAGALVVVERSSRGTPLSWPEGFVASRDRRYGETVLWYGHAGPDEPATDPEEGES